MRVASQLPDGEAGDYVLKLATKLQQDLMPWVLTVPMDIAIKEELACREVELRANGLLRRPVLLLGALANTSRESRLG